MKRILILTGTLIISAAVILGVLLIVKADPTAKDRTVSGNVSLDTGTEIYSWREKDRTGITTETGLLKSWPAEGPDLIWAVTSLPKGFSSVSFGNNHIYITGLEDKNDVLVALDASGNILWKTPFGRCWDPSYPESRSTPTIEGDRVYIASGYGDIACIDGNNGSVIWALKASEEFKGTYGDWGIAESLIIDGQKLYFNPGGPETMTVALDKSNGNVIWKSESINDGPSYVSPLLVDYSGKKILINVSLHHIYGVDVSNGRMLWNLNHTEVLDSKKSIAVWNDAPLIKCVTPVFQDGRIYVTGGYDHGGIRLSLMEDGTKVSVDWTDEVLDVHHGGVVLLNGYIYGANWLSNTNGNWCCIDWNTGKKMWEEHWKNKGSIISADGLLYIYDEKTGFVGLVRPGPEKFDLISSFRIKQGSGPYWAHPVIHNGVLYLRHGEALMAYDIKE